LSWTRRHPLRPLTCTALRAVLRRINDRIGANITLHDLRHTLGLRLIDDPNVSLVDVQHVMRHRRITTTGGYLRPRTDEVIAKVHEHYTRPKPPPRPLTGWSYDSQDLADVFGADEPAQLFLILPWQRTVCESRGQCARRPSMVIASRRSASAGPSASCSVASAMAGGCG
jgi:hypothetical protein